MFHYKSQNLHDGTSEKAGSWSVLYVYYWLTPFLQLMKWRKRWLGHQYFSLAVPRLPRLPSFCPGFGLQCHSCPHERVAVDSSLCIWQVVELFQQYLEPYFLEGSIPHVTPYQDSRWMPQCPLSENHPLWASIISQYPLWATGTVSPCRPCWCVSVVVEASYLVLVVMLEGRERRPAFVGHRSARCLVLSGVPHILSGICYRSMVLKPPVSPALILCSLLTVLCNSATWHIRSSACLDLMQALVFSSGEVWAITATYSLWWSLLPSFVWVEVLDISGAFSAGTWF